MAMFVTQVTRMEEAAVLLLVGVETRIRIAKQDVKPPLEAAVPLLQHQNQHLHRHLYLRSRLQLRSPSKPEQQCQETH